MNNKSGLQGAAPAGAFRRPTAVRRLLGRRWVLSPRRGETSLVMPNAANHLQGPMLTTASITGFAGISHFTLRRRAHNVRPYGLFSVKPEIPVVLRQYRTIPALRLKHRSGSCGTSFAVSALRIMRYCPYSFFISLYSKNSNPLFLYTCTARAFSSSTSSRSRASGYFFVM